MQNQNLNHEQSHQYTPMNPGGNFKEILHDKLEEIIFKIKQNWLKFFVLSLVVVLALSIIIAIITPPRTEEVPIDQPSISGGIDQLPASTSIIFNHDETLVPRTVALYTAASTPQSPEVFAASLAQKLDLTPVEDQRRRNRVWSNPTKGIQLILDAGSKQLRYTAYDPTEEDTHGDDVVGEPFNVGASIVAAEGFLNSLENYPPLKVVEPDIFYLGHEIIEFETGENAEVIVIPFTYEIGGYQAYFGGTRLEYASVQVDREGFVTKADFFTPPPIAEFIGEKNTISLEKAAEEIAAGKAIVIEAGSENGIYDTSKLGAIRINSTELEYRFDSSTNSYIPYFRFNAEGEYRDSVEQLEPMSLTLVLPAVPTNETTAAQ